MVSPRNDILPSTTESPSLNTNNKKKGEEKAGIFDFRVLQKPEAKGKITKKTSETKIGGRKESMKIDAQPLVRPSGSPIVPPTSNTSLAQTSVSMMQSAPTPNTGKKGGWTGFFFTRDRDKKT